MTTVLQEQLGLKFEAVKDSVDVLAIDQVDAPVRELNGLLPARDLAISAQHDQDPDQIEQRRRKQAHPAERS